MEAHPTKGGGIAGKLLGGRRYSWEEVSEEELCGMVLQQNALAVQLGEICPVVGGSSTLPATGDLPMSCIVVIWHSPVAHARVSSSALGILSPVPPWRCGKHLPLHEGKEDGVQHT